MTKSDVEGLCWWDFVLIILMFLMFGVIILLVFWSGVFTANRRIMQVDGDAICLRNGFSKMTDQKFVSPDYGFVMGRAHRIECDLNKLNTTYIVQYGFEKVCVRVDKWGDCTKHDRVEYVNV